MSDKPGRELQRQDQNILFRLIVAIFDSMQLKFPIGQEVKASRSLPRGKTAVVLGAQLEEQGNQPVRHVGDIDMPIKHAVSFSTVISLILS